MRQYEHGGDIYGNSGVELDFSVNTNPLGMPEPIRNALREHINYFMCYPDPHCRELRKGLAVFEDVPEEMILCGNGAADLIYRLCYALKPKRALVCAPTFSEYERALEQVDCVVRHRLLTEDNGFAPTDEIAEQITDGFDMLFLCNPNNPTGRLFPKTLLDKILERARHNRVTVVIDECFLPFTDGVSAKRYLSDMPKLVILKAFTKIYSMAGLRLGYLLCGDPDLLSRIEESGQCWSVSVPAQVAGTAALGCTDWIEKTRRLVTEQRSFLAEGLRSPGLTVYPSDANFLLLRCEKPLYEPLLKKGILIRRCENFIGLDSSYYRVAVRTHEENSRLIKAIRETIAEI